MSDKKKDQRPRPPKTGDAWKDDVGAKVDELHAAMIGDPHTPGYFERIRRLEADKAKRDRLSWVAISAALAAFIKGLF